MAQNRGDDIIGIWLTRGKEPAKIKIYKSGNEYFGKIIWLKNPLDTAGKPKTDVNNPEENKQSELILGLVILKEFKLNGEGEWKSGNIYDPESGKTYNSYMYLKDKNTLKVRGYVGFSLLGRTETWTRMN
jgi:uncharacterized protein (DUF2147 family)